MTESYLTYYRGNTVLVTGGAGSIGSNLSRELARLGAAPVIVLDDLSAAYRWNVPADDNVLFVRGSVTDEVTLKRVFQRRPAVVFHLAAFFANQNSVDYPERDLMTNGLGALKVFQYAQMCGVERLVYASSGCSIYGAAAPLPLDESFVSTHLTTPYQITKMLGELYANFFHHHYGLKVVKTRLFNSYGPGEVPGQYRNVIPNFIYWAMSGRPLPLTGSGDETRDFTYVGDVVDALLRAGCLEAAVGEEMNVASGVEVSIGQLAEEINRRVGNRAGVVRAEPRAWDTKKRLWASIARAEKLLGYQPRIDFTTGLDRTIDWFRANWDRIRADAEFPPGMSAAVDAPAPVSDDGDGDDDAGR